MRLRFFIFALLSALILLAASQNTSAQALAISSGGQPTITSAVGGSVKVCTQSTHVIRSPFDNDPSTSATIGTNGRVSYTSSLGNLSGSTVVLSGPQLSKNNSSIRQLSDGYVFDAIFTLTPQFFASGISSATLIFTISAGPNVPC